MGTYFSASTTAEGGGGEAGVAQPSSDRKVEPPAEGSSDGVAEEAAPKRPRTKEAPADSSEESSEEGGDEDEGARADHGTCSCCACGSSRPKVKVRDPNAVRVDFSKEALEAEIEALRGDLPEYVSDVASLTLPALICDDDGELKTPTQDEGPWDLDVTIRGSEANEAYNHPFKATIRFDRTWPMEHPEVRFRCVIHHALTSDSNGMLAPFYRTLPRDDNEVLTVKLVLRHLHDFLVDPMKAWKVPKESMPLRLTSAITVNSRMNKDRLTTIGQYSKLALYPELFETPAKWRDEWLEPSFREAIKLNTPEAWRAILQEHLTGEVFSFKIFTDLFLQKLTAEIFNFYESGLTARRPNSMNNYGIILNEIGLEPLIDELQRMLQPLGELLWPGPGSVWDGHHCFIVRYRSGEDLGLDMHTDDSDVTFNICLGMDFKGAGLQFCGLMGAANHRKHTYTFQHVKGTCVCHLGRKRHGADDISEGERLNLILWNHSSAYRQSNDYKHPEYKTEQGPPDQVCVSYTHDRDYGIFKEYPMGKEKFKGRGWCPPKPFEYPDFKADAEKVEDDSD
mmetsp:Transcript_62000/g.134411  ORF Transcript_62000/g.134411 Transcript_62000/m.134411 type:complete len:566 (-) Transcript_62000:110-1807(-)